MKRILFCILLLASLTACSAASSQGSLECNKQEGVCIYIKAEEPIIAGEPVTVTVTVKGDKDIPDLGIALEANGNVYFEEPSLKTWKKTGIDWKVNVKADKSHISKQKVLFPVEDGFYQLLVTAYIQGYGLITGNYINISIKNKEGMVYYPGTKVPITEGPLPASTPGPLPASILTQMAETVVVPSYP